MKGRIGEFGEGGEVVERSKREGAGVKSTKDVNEGDRIVRKTYQ